MARLRPTPRALTASAALLLALALVPVAPDRQASAFSVSLAGGDDGGIVRWPSASIGFHLHPACSDDLPTLACLDALRASFTPWEAPSCTALDFVELSTTATKNSTAIGFSYNGDNELSFIENSAWPHGTYTLGVTAPYFYSDGTIFEADIAFNGYLQEWSLSNAAYTTDVENVAVHEIGHFFGMQHVLGGYDPNEPPTMAPTADPFMKSETPEADDLEAPCFLYPATSFTCSSTDDCPFVVDKDSGGNEFYVGKLSCGSGLCGGLSTELPSGDGVLGDACVNDNDCADPWFCQPLDASSGLCTETCSPGGGGCQPGYACVPYSNQPSLGVCLPDSGGGGPTLGVGDPCDSSAECLSGLCVLSGGVATCHIPCGSDGDCPAGEECSPLPGAGFGACTPVPDSPSKGLGEPCNSGTECASGLCAGGASTGYACTQPCTSDAQCADDEACLPLSGGGGGCFPSDDPGGGTSGLGTGDACESNEACASGSCVSLDGSTSFCTAPCAATADCPCGMQCVDTNAGALCVPGDKISCVPEGEACSNGSECTGGLCLGGVCALGCSVLAPSACGPDLGCQRLQPGAPEGVCVTPGPGGLGLACGGDDGCQSLFCHAGVCATPCSPFGPVTCSVELVCEDAVGQLGWCVAAPEPDPGPEADAGPAPPGDDTDATDDDAGPSPGSDAGPSSGSDGGAGAGGVDPGAGGTPGRPLGGGELRSNDGGCAGARPTPAWWVVGLLLVAFATRRRRATA